MPRLSDDILIGGARIFVVDGETRHELGWLTGEFKLEEQADSITVKESEGGTVLTLATNKEVHLTFSMLECNLDTIVLLNPSAKKTTKGYAVGSYQSEKMYQFELWSKKRSGKYRGLIIYKGKISGNFTAFLMNQDNESPISVDIVGIEDSSKGTEENIYEQIECEADDVPGGGW